MNVSIIVINYNTFDFTCQCLQSIFNKTTSELEFEVIVVDNNSTETDPELFKDKFPGIKLITSDENSGFARGNNLGISNATGEYILLLNSDTELKNDAITFAYKIISKHNNIGVLTGKLLYNNGNPQPVANKFPSIKREIFDLFRLSRLLNTNYRKIYYLGTEADYTRELEVDWVWGSFFMFRKKDLELFPHGRLHDNYFMYYEDVQWCYYFKKVLHKKILYSPLPEVYHYIGGSDHAIGLEKKYFERILPNEFTWMKSVKGILYTKLFYLIKSIHYLSMRQPGNRDKGRIFFNLFLRGPG